MKATLKNMKTKATTTAVLTALCAVALSSTRARAQEPPWASDPAAPGDLATETVNVTWRTPYASPETKKMEVRLPKAPSPSTVGIASALVSSGSYSALPANRRTPVVLMIHGLGGWGRELLLKPVHDSIARHLASRGFAVALFGHPHTTDMRIDIWRRCAMASIKGLVAANADPAHPLHGRLDFDRFVVMGHSYGGATAIATAASEWELPVKPRACVALAPGVANRSLTSGQGLPDQVPIFLDYAPKVRCPTLVVGSDFDYIVPPGVFARPAFARLVVPKLYIEISRAEHMNYADVSFAIFGRTSAGIVGSLAPAEQRRIASRYATSWIEHHLGLRQDPAAQALRRFVDGTQAASDLASGVLLRTERGP